MNNSKKQIIIVSSEFPPQPGGIGSHSYQLARSLSEKGFIVKVITDQRSTDGKEELDFDRSLNFSVLRVKKYSVRFLMYLTRIKLTFFNYREASHVIATGKFSLWNVAICSLFFKNRTLAIAHGSEVNFKSKPLKASINLALKRFHTIVAVSNFTKELLNHLQREIVVIPNGIDLSQWKGDSISNKFKGNPIITTVGRLSSRKGQLKVIKHLPQLIKKFPDIHYHCVGISTEAPQYMKTINNLNVSSHITFHGVVDFESLKSILLETDIFVMLSTETSSGDVEGFGIAILEANALGVPAIGSINSGIKDAIEDGKTGRLIDSNIDTEFLESIEMILKNRSKFSINAEKWASMHDWNIIVNKYIALLN